jgi:hypothetical protein
VTDYDDDFFCFCLDDAGLELGGTSGAPILDRRGRVLGVHVRYETNYEGLVGSAIAAPALRGFLCDALDPERLLGEAMSHRRHISMSIHVKTLATLTLHQAESVVSGVDRDTGELCHLLEARPLRITLTYPMEKPYVVSIGGETGETGERSLWLGGVLWHVAKGYEEVYKDPEKYGVWGHGLSDLYLEGLIIDGDTAELLVGS